MGSIFTTTPGNTVKGFGGRIRPIPFYLQFVPGFVVDVVHSAESKNYINESTINTIIALPHIHDKTLVTKSTSTGEEYRYYPLLRTMNDVPSKGDPVLLCTIGQTNYYLGPLNTMANNPTWNDDPNYKQEFIFDKINEIDADIRLSERGKKGESLNFNRNNPFSRMTKFRKPDLDYGDVYGEVTGDTIFEGRHGNSLRIGSRSNNPYIFISNKRNFENTIETLVDGSLITITSKGTLAQHFPNYTVDTGFDTEEVKGFTLASDIVVGKDTEPNRYMGTLVSSVNNNQNTNDLIYNYNGNQMLLHSDRITLNSKLNDIYLSSKQDIHIGARRHLTISTSDSLFIESNAVNIGNPNTKGVTMESMVLGEKLQIVLKKIVGLFDKIKIASSGQPAGIVTDPTYATGVGAEISDLDGLIDAITSTKHKIEQNPPPPNEE